MGWWSETLLYSGTCKGTPYQECHPPNCVKVRETEKRKSHCRSFPRKRSRTTTAPQKAITPKKTTEYKLLTSKPLTPLSSLSSNETSLSPRNDTSFFKWCNEYYQTLKKAPSEESKEHQLSELLKADLVGVMRGMKQNKKPVLFTVYMKARQYLKMTPGSWFEMSDVNFAFTDLESVPKEDRYPIFKVDLPPEALYLPFVDGSWFRTRYPALRGTKTQTNFCLSRSHEASCEGDDRGSYRL